MRTSLLTCSTILFASAVATMPATTSFAQSKCATWGPDIIKESTMPNGDPITVVTANCLEWEKDWDPTPVYPTDPKGGDSPVGPGLDVPDKDELSCDSVKTMIEAYSARVAAAKGALKSAQAAADRAATDLAVAAGARDAASIVVHSATDARDQARSDYFIRNGLDEYIEVENSHGVSAMVPAPINANLPGGQAAVSAESALTAAKRTLTQQTAAYNSSQAAYSTAAADLSDATDAVAKANRALADARRAAEYCN